MSEDYAYMSLSTEEFIRLTGVDKRHADLIANLRKLEMYHFVDTKVVKHILDRHEQEQA